MNEEGDLVVFRTTQGRVRFDSRKQMWSLTDMYEAAGGEGKRPRTWLREAATKELIVALEARVLGGAPRHVVEYRMGGESGMWAHWQVASAYAATLTPGFYLQWSEWALVGSAGKEVAAHLALTTAATLSDLKTRIAALEASLGEPATAGSFTYRRVPKQITEKVDLDDFPKRPWVHVIHEVLRQVGRPLRPLEVTALLQEAGVPIDPLQVSRLLWKLTRDGRARRDEAGGYTVCASEDDTQPLTGLTQEDDVTDEHVAAIWEPAGT